MNTLFILGNGFDINVGLRTRYQDFYNVYSKSHSPHDSVMKLKEHIGKNTDGYWSDLELALGDYTNEFKCTEDFDEVIDDIRTSLSSYLGKVETEFSEYSIDTEILLHDLNEFEEYLIPTDQDKILEFKEKFINSNWLTNIVNFNYTNIVENIIENIDGDIIGNHPNSNLTNRQAHVLNKNIVHIHGLVGDGMILGVNDLSQVSNTDLHNNIDIEESIIKSKCNEANGEKSDLYFNQRIEKANIICAFGLSFGNSDKIWWEKIGEKLRQGCILIIFDRKYNISKLEKHKLARLRREIKSHFLGQTGLDENTQKSIIDNIFIGINTSMFQNIASKKKETGDIQQFGTPIIHIKQA